MVRDSPERSSRNAPLLQRRGEAMGCDDPVRVRLRLVSDEQSDTGYAAWDDMYRDNVKRVHRMLYAKVGNRADAEDLTGEVFLAVLRPLRLDVSRAEIRGYLGATARSVLAGFWRRRAAVEVTAITADDVTTLVEDGRDVDEEPGRSMRCSPASRIATAASWSYGSWKAVRSRSRRGRS